MKRLHLLFTTFLIISSTLSKGNNIIFKEITTTIDTSINSNITSSKLIIGRKQDWNYYSIDSLNIVIGFPNDPYVVSDQLINLKETERLNYQFYFVFDSINMMFFSFKTATLDTNVWTKKDIIQSLMILYHSKLLSETERLFYGETITEFELYDDDGGHIRCHLLFKDNQMYLVEVEGSRDKVFSDLSEYFFSGIFYDINSFYEIQNNNENFTLDMVGCVLDENKDTITNYQIYVVLNNDTTFFNIENEKTFSISLVLGAKYIFGFKKVGYKQKHLIVDIVESGTLNDSQYGFEFPLEMNLLKGNVKKTSQHVGTIKYDPFTGYMEH